VIQTSLTLVETKLHTLLVTWKVLTFQILPIIAKKKNTSKAWQTTCVSFTNEGKTQVGWAIVIGRRTWRWISVNDIPPKGSPYRQPDSNAMIKKSLCLETSKKYSKNGVRKTNEQMGKVDPRC